MCGNRWRRLAHIRHLYQKCGYAYLDSQKPKGWSHIGSMEWSQDTISPTHELGCQIVVRNLPASICTDCLQYLQLPIMKSHMIASDIWSDRSCWSITNPMKAASLQIAWNGICHLKGIWSDSSALNRHSTLPSSNLPYSRSQWYVKLLESCQSHLSQRRKPQQLTLVISEYHISYLSDWWKISSH